MSAKRHEIQASEVQGLKYFKALSGLLERLHEVGCERDRAGNRLLHMDQYVCLLLLYLFNPICTSLRALQQASELKKVQQKLGVPRASLGSLSEVATVFDSQALVEVIAELGQQLRPLAVPDKLRDLPGILTAVDGTLLQALPRIAWALWLDEQHKAVKNHIHFSDRHQGSRNAPCYRARAVHRRLIGLSAAGRKVFTPRCYQPRLCGCLCSSRSVLLATFLLGCRAGPRDACSFERGHPVFI